MGAARDRTTNLLGVKGVGELVTIGATPAAVTAVIDALDRAGIGEVAEQLQVPLNAPKIWRLLQQASARDRARSRRSNRA